MSFLTLAGTVIEVQTQGAVAPEVTYIGQASRSFSGLYRSGVRATKRSWQFTLIPMLLSALDTLRAAWGVDVPLTASGDALAGASVSAVVRVGQVAFIENGTDFLVVASITLIEV